MYIALHSFVVLNENNSTKQKNSAFNGEQFYFAFCWDFVQSQFELSIQTARWHMYMIRIMCVCLYERASVYDEMCERKRDATSQNTQRIRQWMYTYTYDRCIHTTTVNNSRTTSMLLFFFCSFTRSGRFIRFCSLCVLSFDTIWLTHTPTHTQSF